MKKQITEEKAPSRSGVHDSPDYYTLPNGQDVTSVIRDLGWFKGFCLGNVLKYIYRAGKKTDNPLPDLKKARSYIDRIITEIESGTQKEDSSR